MSSDNIDATDLGGNTVELDQMDSDLDGTQDAQDLLDQVSGNDVTDPGTAATESTQDLINDGADLALDLDDDPRQERRLAGVVPVDEEITFDDQSASETIEDRIQQEEPDPNSDIVPPDAGRRH